MVFLNPRVDYNLVLNHYFHLMCGYWPTDPDFNQLTKPDIRSQHRPIITESMVVKLNNGVWATLCSSLLLIGLLDKPSYMTLLCCLMDYVLSSCPVRYHKKEAEALVTISLAFFS